MKIWHIALQGCLKGGGIDYGRTTDTGGHIKYVIDLATALEVTNEDVEQTVITRAFHEADLGEQYARKEEQLLPNTRILRFADRIPGYLPKEKLWTVKGSFVESLCEHLRNERNRPDLIHAHYADAGAVACLLKKRFGISFVFSPHSLGLVKRSQFNGNVGDETDFAARLEAEEESLQDASIVIASSRDEAENQLALYENYDASRIRIIAPGTSFLRSDDLEVRKLALRSELSRFLKNPGKPIILALARPVKRKNLCGLIDAFAGNAWLRENANLVIFAGCRTAIDHLAPEQREQFSLILRKIDTYDLYSSVALPKSHEEGDIEAIYSLVKDSGGIFVNPALHEPFGLTLIEAAYCGLPCVSTRKGGAKDIVEEHGHGILVDPDDASGIGEAMEQILSDKILYGRLADSARQAKPKLDWAFHTSRYLKLTRPLHNRNSAVVSSVRLERGLICSDIDNTLTGEIGSLRELSKWLEDNSDQHFVISTGRHYDEALRILNNWKIGLPETLVTSVGSEIYHRVSGKYQLDEQWYEMHRETWIPEKIVRQLEGIDGLVAQSDHLQRPLKLGYLIKENSDAVLQRIRELLGAEGIDHELVYSHDLYLDILPPQVSKGHALRYLQEKWGIPHERTLAAGDSLNDASMLRMAGNAIVVSNGARELSILRNSPHVYFASEKFAAGVLEGLRRIESGGWRQGRAEVADV